MPRQRKKDPTVAEATQAALELAKKNTANFEELVRLERINQGLSPKAAAGAKGAAQSPKQLTAARQHLTSAFDLMGGMPALVAWGKTNPTEFYRLWARLIPRESFEASVQVPLDVLLQKLSNQPPSPVMQAIEGVGIDLMKLGQRQAAIEDAHHKETIDGDYR